MRKITFPFISQIIFQQQLLTYFKHKKNIVFLNSNEDGKSNLIAVSDTDYGRADSWQFGFIGYDYKNEVGQLSSTNFDGIQFPEKYFFTPELLFEIGNDQVEVEYQTKNYTPQQIEALIDEIQEVSIPKITTNKIEFSSRITREKYIENVKKIKGHIKKGDVYEVNYCQEFYAEEVQINPIDIYWKLNEKSPTPFSCFVKQDDNYLISASPERFLKKAGNKLFSQPIKGTIKRGATKQEDETLKRELLEDEKERSENVMIVDLVRNDLSKIAKKNTVKVDELCGIYTYPQVHQMISTVSAVVEDNVNFKEIIKATFPMGSMTGAPKISAMNLIEKYETTKRGLYSGTVGFIDSKGNFDFNVVIRSILYNAKTNYLSFMVGGAITDKSVPEKEYEECMLKAKAIFEVLNAK